MRFQRAESPALLNGHEAARRFFASCFRAEDSGRERLWVAHVDESARCVHVESYDGEPESVDMPVRQIVADAARYGSAGVVLAHNHPGGDPRPSSADCRATRKLARAAEALDLAILDHLVFAGDDCLSMRRMGLL
ncbi:MAG TPA: JAB domain-containing protein [Sphingomicrobium sp.]|nr:JAB domain-containing protein [Sphingomicrobium sp.]